MDEPKGTSRRQGSMDPVQFRGHRGGVIPMHRALTHFRLGPIHLSTSISLCVALSAIWAILLPFVCRLWSQFFVFALARLPLQARLELVDYHTKFLTLAIPCLRMEPVLPGLRMWSFSCAATALLFASTYLLSRRWIPLVYLARGVLLVHASALIYFALWPASFPHTPDGYLEGLTSASLGLISIIPWLFAFTYYIFDFGLLKKMFLTALAMAHLTVFVPFQILMQALVLQKSVLFMPMLYIVFGLPIDILLVIAFYAWGMTWSFRSALSL